VVSREANPLRLVLISFAVATAAVVVLAQAGRGVPLLARNLGAAVAVVFLYVPFWVAYRRGNELADYGFRMDPIARGLAFGLAIPAIVFPIFLAGFVVFYDVVCAKDASEWMSRLAMPGQCRAWLGWEGIHAPRLGWGFIEAAFVQVVVVALPEELFFRGFLHKYCEQALPPKRRVLGGGIGWALVLSSALFALGHLAVGFDPRRLAVFFPGVLFGWVYSATGSILAGTMIHAASNLLIDVLQSMFF
jgi:hypothetical protein